MSIEVNRFQSDMIARTNWTEVGSSRPHLSPDVTWYTTLKNGGEYILAGIILLLASPVVLIAAALIKLSSPGPVFYSQTRLGRHGRAYTIFKLRTMRHDCERHSGPRWATAGDPRITRIGRFLRRAHIDELPQLWNVLRGEMSLVGPRPERPEFVPQLERAIPFYRYRLMAKPGMTGLAQVQLPPDTDLASVRRKLAFDLYYVRNCGPWLDLQVALATAFYLLHVPFGWVRKLLQLPDGTSIERNYENMSRKMPLPAHLNGMHVQGSQSELQPIPLLEMAPCA